MQGRLGLRGAARLVETDEKTAAEPLSTRSNAVEEARGEPAQEIAVECRRANLCRRRRRGSLGAAGGGQWRVEGVRAGRGKLERTSFANAVVRPSLAIPADQGHGLRLCVPARWRARRGHVWAVGRLGIAK